MSSSRNQSLWIVGFLCAVLAGVATPSGAALEDGLLAEWNFNQGDFAATSGDPTLEGVPMNGASIDPDAGFDGALFLRSYYQEYVAIGVPVVVPGQDHSYSVWYKSEYDHYALGDSFAVFESVTTDTLGVGPISYKLYGDVGGDKGQVRCINAATRDVSWLDVDAGGGIGWHNIVVTYDPEASGAEHTVYLDGDLVASMASSNSLLAASGLNIGGSCWDGNDTWQGWIDEVQIWDRVLAPAEITELQGDLARDLYLSLGLDEAWYQSGSVEFESGVETSRYYARLASECDRINDEILLSTGADQDGGLGDSDLAEDGLPDICRFEFTFQVPSDKNAIFFTTQLSSAEMDPSRSVDRYEITVRETYGSDTETKYSQYLPNHNYVDETQPDVSFCIELNEADPPVGRMLTLTFEVKDSIDGILDSGLAVSWFQLTEDGYFDLNPFYDNSFRFRVAPPSDRRLAAGSYTFAQDLVSVSSPMPIRFSVVYNSQSNRYGQMGNRWVHSYDITLFEADIDDDGDDDVIIEHGNGAASYFENRGGWAFLPMYPGIKGELDYDGYYYTYVSDDRMTFRFRRGNHLDFVWYVWLITDRYNNRTYFHFEDDTDAPYGEQLREVTTGNHSMILSYTSYFGPSLLTRVEVNDVSIANFWYEEYDTEDGPRFNLEYIQYAIYDPWTEEQEAYYFGYHPDFPEDSLIETVTNALGEVEVTNEYRSYKQYLTAQTDAHGNRTTNTYLGTRITSTDKLSNTTIRHYNADLRLSTLEKPGGTATFEYDEDGRTTRVVDALGNDTIMEYDEDGNLTYLKDYEGHVIRMAYEDGNLVRRTDQAGKDWTFTYDENGNLLSESDPLGHTTTYIYGGDGLLVSQTDPNGNTTYTEHDDYGYISRIVDPTGAVTSIQNDALGNPTAITGPNGYTTFMEHDIKGRRLKLINPLGGEMTTTYDMAGRKSRYEVTNYPAPPQVTTYGHDALGQITSVAVGDEPAFTIDYFADGTRRSITDPLGRVMSFDYDVQGRMTSVSAPEGTSASKGYTTCDQVSFTTPNGETHLRASDNLGRTIRETDPRGNTMDYTYDPRGLMTHMVNGRGQAISFDHDDAGRLTDVSFPGGAIEHTLDAGGKRTASASSFYGGVARRYDRADRLVSRTDDHGRTVGYRYDASGNILEITYPDGAGVQYTYDAANRMTSVTDWDGRVTRYEYTLAGNLTHAFLPDSSAVSFQYDGSGRLTSKADWLPGTGEIYRADFDFDSMNRITAASRTLPLEPVLDERGDQFAYLADMMESQNDQGVTYDGDGNMTSGAIEGAPLSFEYDPLNRLTRAGTDTYGYDVDGLRVRSVIGGQTRQYVHDAIAGTPHVLVEYDEMGNIVARYVYGQGLISRHEAGGDVAVYHFDVRGSTVALASPAGVVTDTYAYGPFGKVLNRTGTSDNPFLYCGQHAVMDDGNGLNLMRLRYYAPELMRFIQKDQMEPGAANQPQTLNRHAYVLGNPVTGIDPNGDWGLSIFSAVADLTVDLVQGRDIDWGEKLEGLNAALLGECIGLAVTIVATAAVVAVGGVAALTTGAVIGIAVLSFVVADLVVFGVMYAIKGDAGEAFGYTTTGSLIGTAKKIINGPPEDNDGNDTDDDFNDFWPDRENFDGGMSLAQQASMLNGAMVESVCPLR